MDNKDKKEEVDESLDGPGGCGCILLIVGIVLVVIALVNRRANIKLIYIIGTFVLAFILFYFSGSQDEKKALANKNNVQEVDPQVGMTTKENVSGSMKAVINCKNCGAGSTVITGDKAECEYCGSVLEV